MIADSVSFKISDGSLTDTAGLTITINDADDAPGGVEDRSASAGATAATEAGGTNNTTAGSNATGNVLANDTDVDNTPAQLSVTAIRTGGCEGSGSAGTVCSALVGAHGTLTLGSDGSYSYAVNNSDAAVQALNVGQKISESHDYTAVTVRLRMTAAATKTINGADDAPVGVDDSSTSAGATAAT